FPEGTRSRPGQALKMQRGAAQIALRGGLDITPVRIQCEPLGLYKGQPWWTVAKRPLRFNIEVGDDLASA
ncbi:1-acyl-sn-glycerol-3-phosphate acyltransferase, partial [Erysipelatoclostridium ramosum]|nr:1-acyl-sn-glycerol-3-phosphate acyltransferase [Thomasclavelia ramosa]